MFDTVLVANRGEIAVRIIRTLRRLGIRSVAVYSDADADAAHVRAADAAVRVGPPPAAESYLDIPAVVDAAVRMGAQAIHPGYGFLSENPAFARACADAGVVFVGPGVRALEAMADKQSAKALVRSRGVPIIEGSSDPRVEERAATGRTRHETRLPSLTDEQLATEATRIGFPVLVKPSAGGGGKGMQIVRTAADLPDALASARRIARASFGDDTLLLERYLDRPRHIEVQILADRAGSVIHLGERECSLQRRHQKVIEEAPSPVIDAATRARIGDAACEVARAVDYEGAGTVEFLVPADDPTDFRFIEMNTRLQVEHPVTELVTGLDLVELQLRIAAGEPLPIRQAEVELRGHAIEARVYAESPARGFLPTGGTVLALAEPAGPGVRVDSGLVEGAVVTGDYDPMLAKVLAHGADRAEALARLDRALADTVVLGVETNLAYLRQLLATPEVREGRLDTGLLDRLDPPAPLEPEPADLEAAARALLDATPRGDGPWGMRDGWRMGGIRRPIRVHLAGHEVEVPASPSRGSSRRPQAGVSRPSGSGPGLDAPPSAGPLPAGGGGGAATALEDGAVWVHRTGRTIRIDAPTRAERLARRLAALDRAAGVAAPELRAAMPGTVVAVPVADGATVTAGATLVVVEAMKMEHPVTAPHDGVVHVNVAVGDLVRADQVLAVVDPTSVESPQPREEPEWTANSRPNNGG